MTLPQPSPALSPSGASGGPLPVNPILRSRAIEPEFVSGPWGDRYVRFEQHDWEGFKAARHTHYSSHMKRAFVDACGGFVIHRWGPDGNPLPSYVRPDELVCPTHGREAPTTRPARDGKPIPCCGVTGCRQRIVRKDGTVRLGPHPNDLTKYTHSSKQATGRSGKLFDCHPLLLDRLHAGKEPIYLCLEGCLKADATAGTGRLAVSCLSVTLWDVADDDPEHWALWLPLLQKASVVYLVPDSDYLRKPEPAPYRARPEYLNEMVRKNTMAAARRFMEVYDINTRFAVPPYLRYEDALQRGLPTDRDKRMKRGIDDHVAQGGNFRPWHRERNPLGVHIFRGRVSDWARILPGGGRSDGLARDARFMAYLERPCEDRDGTFTRQDAMRDLDWDRNQVTRAWQSCVKRGVLEVWQGRPLGIELGNSAHVFRFEIREP